MSLVGTRPLAGPLPGWPAFAPDEIAAVAEVLASGRVNYWTGEHGRAFEREYAAWAGVPHAVAVANGTVALELALGAVGVGPGDEVVVPAATFVATASAVAARGAVPVVADVDPRRQTLTPEALAAAVTPRTRAVVVVHLAGMPADMPALLEVAAAHGLRVVEDCAQAHGARLHGRPVGSFGDIAAWSFCQDKIMTTAGEGGAVTTADEALWRYCWETKDHGKDYDAVHDPHPAPGFRWVHARFGTNARMSEVQAVVGRRQLARLAEWVESRRRHAALIREGLAGAPALDLPPEPAGAEPAWYRFYLHVRPAELRPGWDRDRIVTALQAEGVACAHGGCTEIYRERAFAGIWPEGRELPAAARLGRTSVALLVHPTLDEQYMREAVATVARVMALAA